MNIVWVIVVILPLLLLIVWLWYRLLQQREIVEMKLHEKELFVDRKRYEECQEKLNEKYDQINSAKEPLLQCFDQLEKVNNDIRMILVVLHQHQDWLFEQNLKKIQAYFPQAFLLNRPREAVSGDFLFVHALPNQRLFILMGDLSQSKGEGATIHLIINNLLNELLINTTVQQPGEFLQTFYKVLADRLSPLNSEMLVRLKTSTLLIDLTTTSITFAGISQPVYYFENQEWVMMNGGKNNTGILTKKEDLHSIQNQYIKPEAGTYIYLVTNGLADQLNSKGSRLSTQRLKTYLAECHLLTLSQQKDFLTKKFNQWRGADDLTFIPSSFREVEDQTDDILVLGLKVDF